MLDKFKKQDYEEEDEIHTVPAHIAIIMDGNGRWAKKKGLPRVAGHREGMKVIHSIASQAKARGVGYITLYAFSTENWKRPKNEVDFLLRLPERFLNAELPKLQEKNVCVKIMGSSEDLPAHTQRAVERAVEETKTNDGLVLNFALNYGAHYELTAAAQTLAQRVKNGELEPKDITEKMLEAELMSTHVPAPDLLIRTSGEKRLSNFMLWQAAYSEFWFTDVLWPDFTEGHLDEAIRAYSSRKRRYGGV
ncbi:undecaprenyl pyrophosphate synthetase [Salsuginibacillus halophilus]|uniref:Isoprenyl transferase n=1 Tax=Salsuginibacillus halophilus TaxID=517424 RepID=A0A2P8HYA6_9BACI|nr:isoprenyl transferase [Salsuginibacillus halophilus]PSL51221.1 undecaprenyl pyrophosphate synthetase [Salsuginibacillus halophilus]